MVYLWRAIDNEGIVLDVLELKRKTNGTFLQLRHAQKSQFKKHIASLS